MDAIIGNTLITEIQMKRLIATLISSLFLVSLAHADCASDAASKKLAGAAKTSFMKKCEADAKVAAPTSGCDAKAADKKLAGAAKTSFLKKCEADAKATPAAQPDAKAQCEAKSAEKKLKGAAKASFEKKCVTDTKAGK
jgi:hypothetical protein